MKKISLIILLIFFAFLNSNAQEDFFSFDNQNKHYCDSLSYSGIWQIGKPSKTYFNKAYNSDKAIITDTLNPYPSNNHSTFEIIIYSKLGCRPILYSSPLMLTFVHKFDTDSLNDGCYIEISYNGCKNWVNIINDSLMYRDSVVNHGLGVNYWGFYHNEDTIQGGIPAFTGKSKGWVNSGIMWTWCLGVKKYVPDSAIVRFNFISGPGNTSHEGWMIDNIKVSRGVCGEVKSTIDKPKYSLVYPNPVENNSVIEFSNYFNDKYMFELQNVYGQKIKTRQYIFGSKLELSRNELGYGMFFYNLINAKNKDLNHSGKFIVK